MLSTDWSESYKTEVEENSIFYGVGSQDCRKETVSLTSSANLKSAYPTEASVCLLFETAVLGSPGKDMAIEGLSSDGDPLGQSKRLSCWTPSGLVGWPASTRRDPQC